MKYTTLDAFLTDEQIQRAWELYEQLRDSGDYARRVREEIIIPNIGIINIKLGQQNDPGYLAYMVEAVCNEAWRQRGSS